MKKAQKVLTWKAERTVTKRVQSMNETGLKLSHPKSKEDQNWEG
jgi:hypothetical protein